MPSCWLPRLSRAWPLLLRTTTGRSQLLDDPLLRGWISGTKRRRFKMTKICQTERVWWIPELLMLESAFLMTEFNVNLPEQSNTPFLSSIYNTPIVYPLLVLLYPKEVCNWWRHLRRHLIWSDQYFYWLFLSCSSLHISTVSFSVGKPNVQLTAVGRGFEFHFEGVLYFL